MAADTVPLPEGTVTLPSTDLVGCASLNQRLGDEGATTLEREIADLAQAQVEKDRGVVITYAGDGLMVAFQSARRAVACAQEIQRGIARLNRSLPEIALKLRVGLHTGEVVNDDSGLHGETLIIAKRIESVAPGTTIFASDTVRGVLGRARGELEDRGEFSLKGIDTPWRLSSMRRLAKRPRGTFPGRTFVGRAVAHRKAPSKRAISALPARRGPWDMLI